jgi:TRAP-type C4-dicarboxylate transport system permease large subunit
VLTAKLFFVAVGAVLFTRLMALSGVPIHMGGMLGDWAYDPLYLVIGMSIVYLILGCFLDPLGLMLVTLPVFLPTFSALGLDLIWFGILVVKYVEIGLLTPPVGFNLFVVRSVVGQEISLGQIVRGVSWFLACEVVIMALLIGFPEISTYLPSRM